MQEKKKLKKILSFAYFIQSFLVNRETLTNSFSKTEI